MIYNLANKKILITREASQAKEFTKLIELSQGKPILAPLLKINSVNFTMKNLDDYNWIFFTSANGVECFLSNLENKELLKKCRIAAVGHKTEQALKKYNIEADFIPTVYNALKMSAEFLEKYPNANNLLLVRGNLSRNILPDFFTKHNILFDKVVVYETVENKESKELLNYIYSNEKIDYITFMSPSTIKSFIKLLDDKYHTIAKQTKVVCIGTTTENLALKEGFEHVHIPEEFTAESMIEVINKDIERTESND